MSMISVRHRRQEHLIPEHLRASSLFPVLAFSPEDHIFLMEDFSIGFAFQCEPLTGGDEKIQERVTALMNYDFPDNTLLQFILFRSPDITPHINRTLQMRENFSHPLLSPVVRERVDFLRAHSKKSLVTKTSKGTFDNGLIQDLKLIVTVKLPIANTNPTDQEMKDASNLQERTESALNMIGVVPRKMDAKRYKRIMGTMLNWGDAASWRTGIDEWDEGAILSEQLMDYSSGIEVDKDKLKVGDYYVKTLSAKKLPPVFYFGNAMNFVGDLSGGASSVKENYMVVANVYYPPSRKMKDSLENKRKFTINQAHGPMLKFVPVLGEKKESFDILYEDLGNGAKPLQLSYSLVVFAPTEKRAQSAATALSGFWREQRFSVMEDKYVNLPVFLNSLPFCNDRQSVRDLRRFKTMTGNQAAVLLPIFGEWKGTGTFHTSLVSRNGQLMSVSLHDSDTNKNLVIAAESGSGKSFWANELLLSYMSEGAQVWVIDAGKSYKNLCDVLKGDFLEFSEHSRITLSPFELVQDYEDEEDSLVSLVTAMASADANLDEYQVSSLKRVMSELWREHGKSMTVDKIETRCLENDDQRVRDIGTQLYPFTMSGAYGKYFAENNINFKNQFTVLELDELQGRKHLRQVILLQLIYQIQQEVFLGERDKKKVLLIDEAWQLMSAGEVSKFIEHAYRKFRKYGGSVIIATQSINDLYQNAVGQAIAENSASMHLLGQTSETVDSVKKDGRLSLSPGGYHQLKSVHTVTGVYSEIFVKSKNGMGIGRLIVGEFQKLLYSTDPVDVNAIQQYIKRGHEVADAIRCVMRDRGLSDD